MLTNKIFNASALPISVRLKLCFLSKVAMLTNKYTFAYYQILLCLLPKMYKYKNVYMFLYLYIINYSTL